MSLFGLPDELLLEIADQFDKLKDISSLLRTHRRFYHALNRFICELSVKRHNEFTYEWCAKNGLLHHVQIFAERGECSLERARYAACLGGQHAVMEYLIQRGADVNQKLPNGFFPLHAAVGANNGKPERDLTSVRILIDNHARLDATADRVYYGVTALHVACGLGRYKVVELMLDLGMDVDILTEEDSDGTRVTPLFYAFDGFHLPHFLYFLKGIDSLPQDFDMDNLALIYKTEGYKKSFKSEDTRRVFPEDRMRTLEILILRNADLDKGSGITVRDYVGRNIEYFSDARESKMAFLRTMSVTPAGHFYTTRRCPHGLCIRSHSPSRGCRQY